MALSFSLNILPLFRQKDIVCMESLEVRLNDYAYMGNSAGDDVYKDYANARHVLAHLTGEEQPRMPKGGPFWDDGKLEIFRNWVASGCLK
jgi:hypothetical protein